MRYFFPRVQILNVNLLNHTLIKNRLNFRPRRTDLMLSPRASAFVCRTCSLMRRTVFLSPLSIFFYFGRKKSVRCSHSSFDKGHLVSPDFAFKILVSLARRLNFGPGPDFWYGPITPVHLYILNKVDIIQISKNLLYGCLQAIFEDALSSEIDLLRSIHHCK